MIKLNAGIIRYPAHNLWGIPLEFVERKIEIHRIEDARHVPISLDLLISRPRLRRGHTLIHAVDKWLGLSRTFYAEAAEGGDLPPWQFCLFDGTDLELSVEPLGRLFEPNERDWEALIEAAIDLRDNPGDLDGFSLGAIPVVA